MNNKIALVTNVLDYVGPPAVKALLESGYEVLAHDLTFQDKNKQDDYNTDFRGALTVTEI